MPDRTEVLGKIAAKAAYLRALGRELVPTPNPRRVLDRLKETRLEVLGVALEPGRRRATVRQLD